MNETDRKSCPAEELLVAFAARARDPEALDPSELATLEAHVPGCADCMGFVEELSSVGSALRALPLPRPSAAAHDRAYAAVLEAMQAKTSERAPLAPGSSGTRSAGVAPAAAPARSASEGTILRMPARRGLVALVSAAAACLVVAIGLTDTRISSSPSAGRRAETGNDLAKAAAPAAPPAARPPESPGPATFAPVTPPPPVSPTPALAAADTTPPAQDAPAKPDVARARADALVKDKDAADGFAKQDAQKKEEAARVAGRDAAGRLHPALDRQADAEGAAQGHDRDVERLARLSKAREVALDARLARPQPGLRAPSPQEKPRRVTDAPPSPSPTGSAGGRGEGPGADAFAGGKSAGTVLEGKKKAGEGTTQDEKAGRLAAKPSEPASALKAGEPVAPAAPGTPGQGALNDKAPLTEGGQGEGGQGGAVGLAPAADGTFAYPSGARTLLVRPSGEVFWASEAPARALAKGAGGPSPAPPADRDDVAARRRANVAPVGSLVACDLLAAREELLRVLDAELAAMPQDAVWAERVLALARVLGLAGGADLERPARSRSTEGK